MAATGRVDSEQMREELLSRLTDVVAQPSFQGRAQDRAIAADLLLEMLLEMPDVQAAVCSRRLKDSRDVPPRLLGHLGSRAEEVAQDILRDNRGLTDSELVSIVRNGSAFHRRVIAGRPGLGSCVGDVIVDSGDMEAVEILVSNRSVRLSDQAMDGIAGLSRSRISLCGKVLKRPEIRPAQALTLFWWSDAVLRQDILARFSAERESLILLCSDMFEIDIDRRDSDPLVRKTLQFIERRQRNRRAMEISDFESLEAVIELARTGSLTRELVEEISHICGIKPLTGAQIFSDPGGEAVAILCKATRLKRKYLAALWSAMRRPLGRSDALDPDFERVVRTFDMISLSKAQTVLRYWNWSLSSTFSPGFLEEAGMEGPRSGDIDFVPSSWGSRLVFGSVG